MSADGRLLVLRVRVHGECLAHDELVADRSSHVHQLRALLKDELGEDVWLEDLRVETRPRRAESDEDGVDDARAEVARVLADIPLEPNWFTSAAQEFADVQNKLPADLFRGPDAIRLDDADWLAGLLDRVPSMSFTRERNRREN